MIRRRTCHSQIATYDEFDREDAFGRVFFNFITTRGGPGMDIKILENLLHVTIDRRPEKPSPPPRSLNKDYGQSLFSQKWKSGAAEHDRSGKPEKTSWDMMQQFATHREDLLLDGNAHSVRYGNGKEFLN